MMVFKAIWLLALVVILMCIWKTVEYFNVLSEDNSYKSLIALDVVVLIFIAFAVGGLLILW